MCVVSAPREKERAVPYRLRLIPPADAWDSLTARTRDRTAIPLPLPPARDRLRAVDQPNVIAGCDQRNKTAGASHAHAASPLLLAAGTDRRRSERCRQSVGTFFNRQHRIVTGTAAMSALEAPIRSHFHPSLPSLAEVTKCRVEQQPSEVLSSIGTVKEEVMERVAVLPVFAELIRASQLTAHAPLPVLPSLASKTSLRFILDGAAVKAEPTSDTQVSPEPFIAPLSPSSESSEATPSRKRKPRPANRMCKFEGCQQYVVDHGLCVRHGGGKRCTMEGCSSRAKHFGRCWRHGGSMECKVPECANRAKSRGYCWSHGGGTRCRTEDCEKIAISNGLCWAHGGGKRCAVDACMRQAYERTDNMCNSHYQQAKRAKQLR